MSHANTSPAETKTTRDREPEIADAIADVVRAWTSVGLAHATLALESSSHALQRTAAAVALLRDRLTRPAPEPARAAVVDAVPVTE